MRRVGIFGWIDNKTAKKLVDLVQQLGTTNAGVGRRPGILFHLVRFNLYAAAVDLSAQPISALQEFLLGPIWVLAHLNFDLICAHAGTYGGIHSGLKRCRSVRLQADLGADLRFCDRLAVDRNRLCAAPT